VALTPAGQQWLPEVRRVLADAASLPGLAQRLARGEAGTLSLAFVSTADYGILPDLLRRFRARHPNVQLQLREATSDIQLEALMEGSIDAGLVIRPQLPAMPHGVSYLPLVREPLVMAVPEGWRAQARQGEETGGVSLRDAAHEPLIIFPRRSAPAFYDIITGCYAREGLTPVIAQEAIQMQTIVSLVSAGMGVALVPASLCNLRRTGVSYLPLRDAGPDIETGLVWREAGAGSVSPVLRSFIEISGALEPAMKVTQKTGIKPGTEPDTRRVAQRQG
jgi:DNA-binding transcriptional LysR family regulator